MSKTIAELKNNMPVNCSYMGKVDNNTIMFKYPNKDVGYILHNTIIAIIHYEDCNFQNVTLNSGGYLTPTTKDRINNILCKLFVWSDNGLQICQSKRKWYIYNNKFENLGEYQDDMIIDHTGKITYKYPIVDNSKLEKSIIAYCKGLQAYLTDNGPMLPESGDCFYCSMHTESGESLGECFKDNDHLLSHIEENYFMGSLNYNAVKAAGYRIPEFIIQINMVDSIVRSVKKYLRKNLGLLG
jgi:hypothetical protein